MNKVILNAVAGIGLFAGTLVGILAATGRLNHAGTAGIPVLNALFPVPPAAGDGGTRETGPADAAAKRSDAQAGPADASAGPEGQEPPGERLRPKEISLQGGEGKAEAEGDKGSGAEPADQGKEPAPASKSEHGSDPAAATIDRDFERLQKELQDARSAYSVGSYFRFDGMPAGITPAQLDEAWKRVQQTLVDLDKQRSALDLRERDLLVRENDVARRQTDLGAERTRLEALQVALDTRIAEFKQQVTIVQADELPALKRNADTLASFGPQKGAELVREQWKTEAGQKEVVKLLELMEKEAVDKLLAALPDAMIRDVLEKRLHVTREKQKGGGKK